MTTLQQCASDRSRAWHTLGGFGALLLWSVSVPVSRSISEKMAPLAAGAWLQLVSGVMGYLLMARSQGFGARYLALPLRYLVIGGLLFVGYMASYFLAIGLADSREQVLEAGLLNYLWPAAGILFSIPIFRKKARWMLAPGLVLAVAGLVLAVSKGSLENAAALLSAKSGIGMIHVFGLGCAVTWGLYSNVSRRLTTERDANAVPLFMAAGSAVLFGLGFALSNSLVLPLSALPEVLGMGLSHAVAYVLWESAMRRGDQTLVLAASFLTPLASVVTTILYLRVSINGGLWAACGLIIAGAILCRLGVQERS